jgi:transport and Golgi organization protein 2
MFGGVCTVMLRLDPSGPWPLLLAAVRDEFMQRPWDPPDAHWPDLPNVIGGRDRVAGGTWMAVDTERPAVAALLNGVRLDDLESGQVRPTRGRLVLDALSDVDLPADLSRYDGFHLLRADAAEAVMWSWDGVRLTSQSFDAGDHIIVNLGADRDEDPLVPYFRPLLHAVAAPALVDGGTEAAWGGWVDLLRGDGLAADDPRGLIIEHEHGGGRYGSTSASLVGLGRDGRVRYDFTGTPQAPAWSRIWPV